MRATRRLIQTPAALLPLQSLKCAIKMGQKHSTSCCCCCRPLLTSYEIHVNSIDNALESSITRTKRRTQYDKRHTKELDHNMRTIQCHSAMLTMGGSTYTITATLTRARLPRNSTDYRQTHRRQTDKQTDSNILSAVVFS